MWGAREVASGLCADCCHRKLIVSDRGTQFTMCLLSKQDPRFPKYPRLPVRSCRGFAPAALAPPPET